MATEHRFAKEKKEQRKKNLTDTQILVNSIWNQNPGGNAIKILVVTDILGP
jgi:hypothetical protein